MLQIHRFLKKILLTSKNKTMKKIISTLAVVFLLGFNSFVKAQVCPPTMPLIAGDTAYVYSGTGTTFNSGTSYACNDQPFFIWANQTLPITTYTNGVSNVDTAIFTPCIATNYNTYWTTLRTRGTESFYEAGFYLGCIGPSGCVWPIGGPGTPPNSGVDQWDLLLSYLDPGQSHDFVFTKPLGLPWSGPPTVTINNCWNNAVIPSVVATPVSWPSATTSFTATTAAGSSIGFCSFTLAPAVPGAITDLNYGYVYVRPNLLPAGTYTMTYFFSGVDCPGGTTSQFVFTITNPYSAAWTAPANLCTNSSCVSLPPTVSGTAGGTWSGTGVSGTNFCPGTSGAGSFGVTYSVGISATCRATQTNSITVNATPTLSVAGGNLCSGQSIVLTNTGSAASGYTWSPSGGSASSATVSPTGNTTYTLTGANGNCSSSTTAAVNVTATPTLVVAGGTICSGQSIVLTNTGTAAGSYTWSPSGGSAGSATVSPSGNMTYTLSGANGTCTGTTTATVNVNATPTLAVTGGTICAGQNIVLTNTGTAAGSYTWSPSGGSAGSATVSPGGNTTYTLTGANGTCTGSTTAVVNVTPSPTIGLASSAGATICSGGSTTLTASGASNYTWSPNAGGGTTNPVVVSPSGNTTYTVTGESSGCTSTQVITVNVTPTPTVLAVANSATLCAGQSTVLTGSGATTYTWMPGSVASSTILVTPGSTSIYTVTGENSGCTSTQTVAVNVNQLPTIGVNAAPASVCTGQTTTITASGATTYTWSANAGGGNGNPVTVTPGATDTYTVTGTDNNGCINTNTVTVIFGTSAAITITPTSNTVCAGGSITLSGSGATNYTWSPGSQTTSTITVTPTGPTSYTLTGDNGGCMGTQTITVNSVPNPTVATGASSQNICSGQSTVLTGSGATNYTWMPGSATTSTISVTPGATATYTLTGETAGCTDTDVITVNVTITPTVTAVASTGTICAGQSVVLTGGGAGTYTWMPGGMTAGTVTVNPSTNTTYTLTGANGVCTATETVAVNVTALPNVTASSSSNAICGGQSAVVTAGGATTYTWMPGGANTSTLSVNPAISTVYTVTGTSNGCDNSAVVSITVTPTPTIGITASSGTICAGQSTTLNGAGATNYTWNPGGINSPSTGVTPVVTTTYTLTGETNGCTATETVAVIVNPTPTLGNSPSIDSSLCGMPTGGVANINVTGGTPGYTYQWYNGSTPITGANTDSLTGMPIGTYSVLVTDANGCVASGGTAVFTIPGSLPVTAGITPGLSQGPPPLNVVFVNNSSANATVFAWNFGNGASSTAQNPPGMSYTSAGVYTVTLYAYNGGCWDTTSALVIVDVPTTILIPNIFSPNGDGINDEFFIFNTGLSTLTCDIFNRWGQRMFTLNAPQQVWDGKTPGGEQASEGTYFYILKAVGIDGKTYEREGPLTLVK